MTSQHISVLPHECLELLQPARGGIFVDATLGLGGHASLILNAPGTKRRVIGIDQDLEALARAKAVLGDTIEYIHGNFGHVDELLRAEGIEKVDGILMDLGVSSYQLDTAERGFSFQQAGPLDMRMNEEDMTTAATIVNTWPEYQLAKLFFEYGEERLSRRIAKAIIEDRKAHPFTDTLSLSELIVRLYPAVLRYKHPHPATRVFQALRIAVNQELDVLKDGLEASFSMLATGGVLAVISFHSLEDRIVKHTFRERAEKGGFEVLAKKPILSSDEESKGNPRSRSAKLRGIRRTFSD
jgi:16S rRNA (cytosine1402-N4)-methyltransferase